LQPLVALLENFFLLDVEMTLNDVLKTFWWVPDLLDHCVLDIAQSDNVAVGLVFLFAFLGALLSVKSRFIEVDVVTHGDTLGGDEELEQGRKFRIPVFACTASPRTQKRQTHLTTRVQVGVEPDLSLPCSRNNHLRRIIWIRIITVKIKHKSTIRVRSVLTSHNQDLDQVDSALVASHED
jgi:hypothetical protein